MLETIRKGVLRKGVVTSRYPMERYEPHDGHMGMPAVDVARCALHARCASVCPTGAIVVRGSSLDIDLGACIFCGECARACPEGAMRMTKEFELASCTRRGEVRSHDVRR